MKCLDHKTIIMKCYTITCQIVTENVSKCDVTISLQKASLHKSMVLQQGQSKIYNCVKELLTWIRIGFRFTTTFLIFSLGIGTLTVSYRIIGNQL